jgi:hypothetical protein
MIIKQNRLMSVKADKKKRTFAIKIKHENGSSVTCRTPPLSKNEYEANLHNTQHDWLNYLRGYEYYRVI